MFTDYLIEQDPQYRVFQGDASQQAVDRKLKNLYGDRYELVSMAPRHSKAPDLVALIDGFKIQVEIKHRADPSKPIKFYEKSIGRGQPDKIFDKLAKVYTSGTADNFGEMVDNIRQENSSVGFPGDEGVVPSGSIWLNIYDRSQLSKLRGSLIDEMHANGDNYLAVHNSKQDVVSMYHTGLGSNILRSSRIPNVIQLLVDTYGGSYKNKMRAGIKLILSK